MAYYFVDKHGVVHTKNPYKEDYDEKEDSDNGIQNHSCKERTP